MKQDDDRSTDEWLRRLDAIAAGERAPTANDDELLHLAARLVTALDPLQEIGRAAEIRNRRSLARLRTTRVLWSHAPAHSLPSRPVFYVAFLLLVVLGAGIMSAGGATTVWGSITQLWHASTSLDQINGLSVASLSRPHAGLLPLPLLPAVLPGDTQASTYGVVTDTSHPNVLVSFVADYHIAGQEVLLYEQPSDLPFSASAARTIRIDTMQGQLFQDDAGNNALQWYQRGMQCQITSKLPVARLVALARLFRPIKS
nr:hypothetical protein [Ktedonobacteraceae bacterium]